MQKSIIINAPPWQIWNQKSEIYCYYKHFQVNLVKLRMLFFKLLRKRIYPVKREIQKHACKCMELGPCTRMLSIPKHACACVTHETIIAGTRNNRESLHANAREYMSCMIMRVSTKTIQKKQWCYTYGALAFTCMSYLSFESVYTHEICIKIPHSENPVDCIFSFPTKCQWD